MGRRHGKTRAYRPRCANVAAPLCAFTAGVRHPRRGCGVLHSAISMATWSQVSCMRLTHAHQEVLGGMPARATHEGHAPLQVAGRLGALGFWAPKGPRLSAGKIPPF